MHIDGFLALTMMPSWHVSSLLEGYLHFAAGLQSGSRDGSPHAGAHALGWHGTHTLGWHTGSHLGAHGAGHTGAHDGAHIGWHIGGHMGLLSGAHSVVGAS